MKITPSCHRWLTAAAALALFGCSDTPDDLGGGGGNASGSSSGDPTSSASGNATTSSSSSMTGGGADPMPTHCDNLEGEGDSVGQIAANWTLEDNLGNMVQLHDFCGKVLFFEEGSLW